MNPMPAPAQPTLDLIDLKFLPDWVKEPGERRYNDFVGEEATDHLKPGFGPRERRPDRKRDRAKRRDAKARRPAQQPDHRRNDRPRTFAPRQQMSLPELEVRFLPQPAAFENVVAQIKNAPVAYSVYSLARLFLQKPERYHVRILAKEGVEFFRLAERNIVAMDRATIENAAFAALKEDFYRIEVSETEPIKGNFTSVARERTTGALLGPPNHHSYQTNLRRLYEQRFSRRTNFSDFQRQIQNVTDPALVEQWKEEARKLTRFMTLRAESPQVFDSEAAAEKHFRENYLPTLLTQTREAELDGVSSRSLRDRGIARVIENAWAAEVRSPSNIMQELAGRFRAAGLQIFRHRKGMLFVSAIRPKSLDEPAAADSVRAIVQTLQASPRLNRKELAEKLGALDESKKLALASDLHWLVREGHVIEFSDGALDLPRVKSPQQSAATERPKNVVPPETGSTCSGQDSSATTPDEVPVAAS